MSQSLLSLSKRHTSENASQICYCLAYCRVTLKINFEFTREMKNFHSCSDVFDCSKPISLGTSWCPKGPRLHPIQPGCLLRHSRRIWQIYVYPGTGRLSRMTCRNLCSEEILRNYAMLPNSVKLIKGDSWLIMVQSWETLYSPMHFDRYSNYMYFIAVYADDRYPTTSSCVFSSSLPRPHRRFVTLITLPLPLP